jgi:hypothetical protein
MFKVPPADNSPVVPTIQAESGRRERATGIEPAFSAWEAEDWWFGVK